ncbi:MAG: hypothetical protein LBJ87_03720 [bacterium]|jgi:hypothetical protein|nr:hypothetical protein [bacterium]
MTGTHTNEASEAATQLAVLAGNLSDRGFAAQLTHAGKCSAVSVVNLWVPQLAETVYAAPAGGAWWFWWSWAERIARIGDVEAAAFKIAYVLTPHASVG